jgi:single-stranded-DNA-specific exonuclease
MNLTMCENEKEWKMQPKNTVKVSALVSSLPSISKIAAVLVNRGIDSTEKVKQFIDSEIEDLHNPFLFSDMQKVVNRIRKALDLNETILVYGDKDVDGVTAINIIVSTIRELGGNIQWYVPANEGYGIQKNILLKYAKEKNVKILITVDCGISALNEIAFAKTLGMYVIVTDHHEPPYECVPNADAIINPKICNSKYPFKNIAGCVVSLKTMQALMFSYCKDYNKEIMLCYAVKHNKDFSGNYICLNNGLKIEATDFNSIKEIKCIINRVFKIYTNNLDMKNFLLKENVFLKDKIILINNNINNVLDLHKAYKIKKINDEKHKIFFETNLDLCALGTIADSMPLVDENRIIVKKGLKIIENNPHKRPGLGLLIEDVLFSKGVRNITAKAISWKVTPVLNSSGRMARGKLSVQLLMTKDVTQSKILYDKILKLNENRKCLQSENIEQFRHLLKKQCDVDNDKVLIVKAFNLEHGVTGIIASQIVKTYSKPAFLFITNGVEASGTARSIEGFDVVAALESVKDILIRYGGHNQAAGFTLEHSKIENFTRRISEYVDRNFTKPICGNTISIESELKISDINLDFYKQVEIMEPFGMGNQNPIFYIKNVTPTEISIRKEHLKFKISHKGSKNVSAIFWNKAKLAKIVKTESLLDIAFQIDVDTEKNNNKIAILNIIDIKPVIS